MNTDRKIAIISGVLFIIATVASLVGSGFTSSIFRAPDYLEKLAASGNQVMVGSLLAFVAAATSAGIAISLYPVLKKYNQGLALGSVGFRLIEAVFYTVGIICQLAVFVLSQNFASAGSQGALYFQVWGHVLLATGDLASFVFAVFAFCTGALMYYYIFYQTKLIPRWLSVWGLVAIALLFAAVLITLFDGEPYSISGTLIVLALPIALQEMVLAVWLIVKGFNPAAVVSGSARAETRLPQLARDAV